MNKTYYFYFYYNWWLTKVSLIKIKKEPKSYGSCLKFKLKKPLETELIYETISVMYSDECRIPPACNEAFSR